MKLTPPKWPNVMNNKLDTKPELTTPLLKSLTLPKLSNPSEREREILRKLSKLEKKLLSSLMNKKQLPELKELKTQLTSSLDKNKPLKFLMLLKLSFQNSEPSPHTPPLKLSSNLPNSELPTQLLPSLKLLLPSMLTLLTDASVSSNNYKLISLFSLMTISKMKSKPKLISTTLWFRLLKWEKLLKKNLPKTEMN